MMFLDLDNFKQLNDAYGHDVGDLLLIEAAERLKSCVRDVDTVARFGGDEFVVMISELGMEESESAAQAGIIAEKIRAAMAKPYVFDLERDGKTETAVEHQCTASIGAALFGKDDVSQDEVLKRADTAMYQAKGEGSNLIRFYDARI
jgi:diguanylate cyclase (GGDEF)-like protein